MNKSRKFQKKRHLNLRRKDDKPDPEDVPTGYHSKLSEWPYVYAFYPNLSTTNFMFIVKHVMENYYTLSYTAMEVKK